MYTAVKLNASRDVIETLPTTFNNPRQCLEAARKTFGNAGGLQFQNSKQVIQ